jgi:acetoin utilization deacetylase AcuC-like enzyme
MEGAPAMKTGLVWHEDYMRHDSGMQGALESPHPFFDPLPTIDTPVTKKRFKALLDRTGMTDRLHPVAPRPATRDELLRCHAARYLDRIERESASGGGEGGEATPFGHDGYAIAALAAGGVIAAVDAVMTGAVDNCFALVHPPGHHARADEGVGFCLFANGPVAVWHARRAYGLTRIAIVDWDVHHGNAAQEMFWRDPGILALSIHQADCYPVGSGDFDEIGEGDGEGYTLNIPLPPGSGEEAYASAMDRIVTPALRAYRPELILVACGFDAGMLDPLGRMRLNSGSFGRMTAALMAAADEICQGRVVVVQEGGYDASSVPFHGLATIEAMCGQSAGIDNPFAYPPPEDLEAMRVDEHTAIQRAEATLRRISPRWGG